MFWFLRKPSGVQTKVVHDSVIATSEAVDLRSYAGGNVTVSAGITTLTFYGCQEESGTYLPILDQDGVAVILTVASTNISELPSSLYSFYFIKALGDAAGTAIFALKS
jgi:hypothetical protein